MDKTFNDIKRDNIRKLGRNASLRKASIDWIEAVTKYNYPHNFTWMGLPIIQFPQDIMAMQEIIWKVQPSVIVETGIARGGSLVFYASMLNLLGSVGHVVGVDIDIRQHTWIAIRNSPLADRITMIQGSSVDPKVVKRIQGDLIDPCDRVLVVLDSDHTHNHVLRELELYSPLVSKGSYLVAMDTVIEDLPDGYFPDREWGKGNNPKTAVAEFLKTNDRFVIDTEIPSKLVITVTDTGYLKCVKD